MCASMPRRLFETIFRTLAWTAACALLTACGGGGGGSGGSTSTSTGSACEFAPVAGVFVDRVVDYQPINSAGATISTWPYFFQPNTLKGPPCGINSSGLFDGISLGYNDPIADPNTQGGFVVVGLGDASGHRCAVDDGTAAADLAVYGNQFYLDGTHTTTYNKIATVEVTDTYPGGTWYPFPPSFNPLSCNISFPSNTDPSCYINFAGVQPTLSTGGALLGDRFDLSTSPVNACYVRLTDGGSKYPDYGDTQSDLFRAGAAIDAIQALNSVAAPGLTP
jgi:hypothetical protein